MSRAFGWLSIVRLGLVQACLGAVVVMTTSTLNRVMVVELALMDRFLQDPSKRALEYSGFGVPLFVAGMMVSAFALRAAGAME